eukprot:gnl/TRDRNA2_/TRDRNA2_163139_c0_seq1.p1 gnl/TRDRNA2_/TRDRNA2_163139_c0~~gnl/TRDRNA2_/TRDRNA2_163139_c0_seq1.p1  ORF type:complete len:802 (-),score=191.89 gnl/TRDRNA2_/TRDRNA2_163139_c0_seq1:546-2951(-)
MCVVRVIILLAALVQGYVDDRAGADQLVDRTLEAQGSSCDLDGTTFGKGRSARSASARRLRMVTRLVTSENLKKPSSAHSSWLKKHLNDIVTEAVDRAIVKPVKDDKLKRPPNAFVLWLKEWLKENHESIVAEVGPSYSGAIKKGAEIWRTLTDEDKKPYEERAEKGRKEYFDYIATDEGAAALKAYKDAKAVRSKMKEYKAAVKSIVKNDKLKQPSSAYNLWLKENIGCIIDEIGKGGPEAVKKGAEVWNSLPDEDKKYYEDRADEAREEYSAYIATAEGAEALQAYKEARAAQAPKEELGRTVGAGPQKVITREEKGARIQMKECKAAVKAMMKDEKLKKPLNPYVSWLKEWLREIIVVAEDGEGNAGNSEAIRVGAQIWHTLSDEEKKPYNDYAQKAREEYFAYMSTDEGAAAHLALKDARAEEKGFREKIRESSDKVADKPVKEDVRVKKPLNAYFLWLKEWQEENQESIIAEIGPRKSDAIKKGAEVWQTLTDEQKKPFEDRAKKAREEYFAYISTDEGAAAVRAHRDARAETRDLRKKIRDFKTADTAAAKPILEDDKVKKPPNAYVVWLKEWLKKEQETIVAEVGTREAIKKGAEIWKSLTDEERRPYEHQADMSRKEYFDYISTAEGAAARKAYKDAKALQSRVKEYKAAVMEEKFKKPANVRVLWVKDLLSPSLAMRKYARKEEARTRTMGEKAPRGVRVKEPKTLEGSMQRRVRVSRKLSDGERLWANTNNEPITVEKVSQSLASNEHYFQLVARAVYDAKLRTRAMYNPLAREPAATAGVKHGMHNGVRR